MFCNILGKKFLYILPSHDVEQINVKNKTPQHINIFIDHFVLLIPWTEKNEKKGQCRIRPRRDFTFFLPVLEKDKLLFVYVGFFSNSTCDIFHCNWAEKKVFLFMCSISLATLTY